MENVWLAVTYLVFISSVLFSNGRLYKHLLSSCFPLVNLNIDLWPLPSNLI